ncbi:MAG: NADH-quinone oxidoreductase subunit C [Candidatus Thorarchaeota archaeon]|nr:NADH-quinone oxidoreductase subunit C [Candidatus Thorarchaeota archaeon]
MSGTESAIPEYRPAERDESHKKEYALLDTILRDQPDAVVAEECYVHVQPRRVFIRVHPEKLRDFIVYMQNTHDMWQFSTLSGRDLGDDLQANYHFFLNAQRIAVTIRLNVPRDHPEYPSITDLVPGAEFVENELRELFGIFPVGHPNVRRCELPENWPSEEYPLRKDWADPRGLMKRSKTVGPKPKEEL